VKQRIAGTGGEGFSTFPFPPLDKISTSATILIMKVGHPKTSEYLIKTGGFFTNFTLLAALSPLFRAKLRPQSKISGLQTKFSAELHPQSGNQRLSNKNIAHCSFLIAHLPPPPIRGRT
jgi:hypothetical protein